VCRGSAALPRAGAALCRLDAAIQRPSYAIGRDLLTSGRERLLPLQVAVEEVGGGLSYRMESNRRRASLPVEAAFHYAVAVYGSQGLVPKSGRMSLSLRFFYNLWGRAPAPEPEPQPAPEPEPPPPTRLPAAGFRRP